MLVARYSNPNKHGFTLVEMLIIAPIVIIVIGIFISAIISMTGAVLVSRGANALSFSINDAMTRIDQDVKASGGFLAANNITLQNGQGLDDAVGPFKNATSSSATDAKLILNSFATDKNPLTPTRNIIDAANSPFSCSSPLVSQNASLMTNIVYFVKSGTLWRRVIMPNNYSLGSVSCTLPWQKPTCTPGYSATFCAANDQRLVDGVTSITITYWDNQKPPVQIVNASDYNLSDTNRQISMNTAGSIKVDINASKNLSGRNVTQSGSIRSLSNQAPTMLTQPANPTSVSAPGTATFTTAASGANMTIKWEQSIDNGVTWTAVSGGSGGTSAAYTTPATTNQMDGTMYRVIYTNSFGQAISSPARLTVTSTTGWNSLSYQNSWADYLNNYNTGQYMKTSSGVVVLKGLLKRTGTPSNGETIAVLPPGYRPSAQLIFGIGTNPNVTGRVDVYPDGRVIFVFGDLTWFSLENVHFIADGGRYASTNINTFMNSWRNYGTGGGTLGWGQASYIVDNIGRVNLQGLLMPGTRGDGVRIFDLPSNLLPSAYMHVAEQCNGFTGMGITPNWPGYSAIVDKNLGASCFSINVMYYPAAVGTWTNLTLQNGWVYYGGDFTTPQYTKAADGIVSLKGFVKSGTVGAAIATLPANCRPSSTLHSLFATYSAGAFARLDIQSTGALVAVTGSNGWYSLDGITFLAENTSAC